MLLQLPLNCRCMPVSMLLLRCMAAAAPAGGAAWGYLGHTVAAADLLLWDAAQLAARPGEAAGRAVSIMLAGPAVNECKEQSRRIRRAGCEKRKKMSQGMGPKWDCSGEHTAALAVSKAA
jgi:hypothetical protein